MKIWIALAETDSGNEMAYFYSEADAERYAFDFCKERWGEDSDPMPTNWREAYEALTADPSYADWLHMDDLDISGHPDLLAVNAGLANIVTRADNENVSHLNFRGQAKACAENGLKVLHNDY